MSVQQPGVDVLAQMLQASHAPMLLLSPSGDALVPRWHNRAFARLTGFDSDALSTALPWLAGDDAASSLRAHLDTLSVTSGRPDDDDDAVFALAGRRADGDSVMWQVDAKPLDGDEGLWLLQVGAGRPAATQLFERTTRLQTVRRELADAAREDPVTGLPGRAIFDEQFGRYVALCHRQRLPLALVVLEVESFDIYTRTFGVKAGEWCLRLVARGISTGLRRGSDLLARLSEHRFVAAVVDMDETAAEAHARSLAAAVERLKIHNPRAPGSRYVSVSTLTVAGIPDTDDTLDAMLTRAARRDGGESGVYRLLSSSG